MGDIADEHSRRFYEDYDYYDDDPTPTVTCNRCGKQGLYWTEKSTGWRLISHEEIHVCASLDVTDLFDVIK